MAKLVLDDVGNLANANAAAARINDNFDRIEAALEKTVSRDGSAPNQMEANLDMNSKRILNLPKPVNPSEPARLADLQAAAIAAVGGGSSAPSVSFVVGNAVVERLVVATYGASITPVANDGNWFVISPNNNSAFTINPPTATLANTGQRITITIKNDSGAALGSATWVNGTPGFRLGASWTQPANGFSRSIEFRYDGTNWVEVGRTAADVTTQAPPPPPVGFLYATDDFERASLGVNWSQDGGSAPWAGQVVQIVGGVAKGVNPGASAIAYWNVRQPQPDQYAASVVDGVYPYPGVTCRLQPGIGTAYFAMMNDSLSCLLYRYDAGTQVGLGTITMPSALVAGDEMMLEVITIDSSIVRLSVYKNGVFVGNIDDTSANRITNAGYVGVHVWGTSGVRSWRGGDVAGNAQGLLVTQKQEFATTAGTGTTGAFTIPPYTDAVLAVWSDWGGGEGTTMSTLSVGGVSLLPAVQETPLSNTPVIQSNIGIALKVAPASGSKTLSWAYSDSAAKSNATITLLCLRGVKQSDPYRSTNITQTDGSADCQITCSSATGDTVLGFLHNLGAANFPDGTIVIDNVGASGGRNPYVRKQAGTASVTFTMTSENYPSMAAISLKPA